MNYRLIEFIESIKSYYEAKNMHRHRLEFIEYSNRVRV